MKYDYFYEEQSEQFVFYKVPKVLCTEEEFRKLSSDAKLLYGLLLDRVSLSQRNGWVDENGRIYVVFTLDNIMISLNCSDKTATKMLVELEKHGLIERKRQGQGKPVLIYVKNFIHSENLRVLTRKNSDSGLVEGTTLGSEKVRCNNTEFNNTDISETNLILSGDSDMDERDACKQYFIERLEYQALKQQYPYQCRELDEILDLLVDTVCSKSKTIRIAGDQKSLAVVKSQFMKLDYGHIQYVLDCMEKNGTEVRNIKQYLLAMLYNAPLTINNYYTAMFNNDRANGRI
ncbi:MAG: replication initiator protein A [Coprococcus sp.]|nr:replication initiator protein A [Coprococcus sp.]